MVDALQRARDDHSAVPGRSDDLAGMDALDGRVADEVVRLAVRGDGPRRGVDRENLRPAGERRHRRARAVDQLHRVAEDKPVVRVVWARIPLDGPRVSLEAVVELRAQVAAHEQIDRQGRGGDHDGNHGRRDERQSKAEAHGSRSTYPVPRTVWMRRGSSSVSVLRRR